MNKIFKVIWNNTKHCYVVASELAKSYSKGGGSRSIRRAMVTLGVAAAVYTATGIATAAIDGAHQDGDNYIGDSPYNVTIDSDSNVTGSVYGRREVNDTNVEEASVTMTGGTVQNVYGGKTTSGNVASNSVNISGGTIGDTNSGGYVYGGSSNGNAINNSVNISGEFTLIRQFVYGGVSSYGAVASNSVIISGGTVQIVYGGNSTHGNTNSNSVIISGGKVNGIIYGGYSFSDTGADVASNSVNISGGTINSSVYGGYSNSGDAASNSVNISGGTFSSGKKIYAGYVEIFNNSSIIKDNTVNLGSITTNLDNVEIYGFRSGSGDRSGNELHIGRAVDYDDEGMVKRDTDGNIIYKNKIWQGKDSNGTTNNKIKQVANFESIVLHEVAWKESLPALAAASFKYNNSTDLGNNVTLDISSLTFDKDNPTGTMTLLQSDTNNNFSNLKLKYNDNEAATIPDSGTTVKSEEKTLQSKGVKISYNYTQNVSLSDSDKKVNLTALKTYKKAELGSMKWSDGGYTFADSDTIVAGGLEVAFSDNFKVEGAEDKNEGDSLVLLDLSVTNALTNAAINNSTTLTYDKNPTSAASLTLSLSQTDKIKTNPDQNQLKYTVGTKSVPKVTFDK